MTVETRRPTSPGSGTDGVDDGDYALTGEALIAVGGHEGEGDGGAVGGDVVDVPPPAVEALDAAVEAVRAVVRGERVFASAEGESRARDAVRDATNHRAEVRSVSGVAVRLEVVVPEHDVRDDAVAVGDEHVRHRGAEGRDARLDALGSKHHRAKRVRGRHRRHAGGAEEGRGMRGESARGDTRVILPGRRETTAVRPFPGATRGDAPEAV